MKLGVVGLPNVGKSTLFNAITSAGAMSANYPFCTIEPNVGMVAVNDERLDELAKLYNSKKITPTTIEFVDIAGLVKGASKGEGLGNKFLSHIREVDAIVHVVRCFDDANITHVSGKVDPASDIETINLELIFADMETIEKKLGRYKTLIKSNDKNVKHENDILTEIYANLEKGIPVRMLEFEEEDKAFVKGLFLLTTKPVLYACNISENDLTKDESEIPYVEVVKEIAKKENAEYFVISSKVEEELAGLEKDEKDMFLSELGLNESGLDKLVKKCYKLLGLISYLTAGEQETRAWTILEGTKAPQAAGKIHTDFEKGFIKAEVVDYKTLLECGNYTNAKAQGKVRVEGKDYVMKDGDVVLFRFNV